MSGVIDLRSDTVTRPTAAMRAAMAAAEVGDDVFGDDPTVNALQARIASMLGKEAALFRAHRHAEQSVRADGALRPRRRVHRRPDGAHLPLGRRGRGRAGQHPAAAAWCRRPTARSRWPTSKPPSSPTTRTLRARGCWRWKTPGAARCCPCLHRSSHALAHAKGLATHLDGARLFNAAVASGTPVAAIARHFDSVSVCFSKGLGTPAGSALVGSTELIARAHRIRKMLGGGMRQAGVLAAAALHALDHHVERLAEDHANARALAEGLQGLPGVSVQPPQTNIVFVDLAPEKAAGAVERLRAAGVWCTGLYRLRLVTHLDVRRSRHPARAGHPARPPLDRKSPCPSPTPKR
jgi:threonine aldolase